MQNQNLNQNSNQDQTLKSLASSIAHEMRNPLSAINAGCELIKENLNQIYEMVDLMALSSKRGLLVINMILQNIKDGAIDKSKFTDLSIADIVGTVNKGLQN